VETAAAQRLSRKRNDCEGIMPEEKRTVDELREEIRKAARKYLGTIVQVRALLDDDLIVMKLQIANTTALDLNECLNLTDELLQRRLKFAMEDVAERLKHYAEKMHSKAFD